MLTLAPEENGAEPRPDIGFKQFCEQADIRLENNVFLERQTQLESNARSYPRSFPIAMNRASGVYVEDTDGQLFIDCLAGAGTLALGHNHPAIHQALRAHLDSLAPLHTLDFTTPVKDAFMQKLFSILPAEMANTAKVQFCGPTGADAVEAAVKLAKTATGRSGVLAFDGAYHGMTHGTLAMMGNLRTKAPVNSLMPDVQFLPYPNLLRCPFGLEGDASIHANLHYLDNLLSNPLSGVLPPAAIIVEAIQGEGGVVTAPVSWLKGLREITLKFDIPLIFDEVQSGIGRSGKMFAFEHANIVPDMIVMSKAVGGGLPLSMVVYDKHWDKWAPGAHTGTFRGNQMAMVAGAVALDHIVTQDLPAHAAKMGERLMSHLQALQQHCAYIGEVRGKGLMLGVEIVDAQQAPTDTTQAGSPKAAAPFGQLADAIKRQCLQNGLIVESGGRDGSVLRFLPPLIITAQELDKVADIFSESVLQAIRLLEEASTLSETLSAPCN